MYLAGVGAGEDDEVRVRLGLDRRLDFSHHFGSRNHFLVGEVPAAFGHHLVLQDDTRGACGLERPDGMLNVVQIAMSGVSIADHGNPHTRSHSPEGVGHLAQGQETEIGES